MKPATRVSFLLLLPALLLCGAERYRKPPKAVLDVLNSQTTPTLTINSARTFAMQGQPVRNPPIAELAQPMLRIAGMRINPKTNGLHNTTFHSSITLRRIPDGAEVKVDLPPNPKLSLGTWSPDASHFAFTNTTASGTELWIGDTAGTIVAIVFMGLGGLLSLVFGLTYFVCFFIAMFKAKGGQWYRYPLCLHLLKV